MYQDMVQKRLALRNFPRISVMQIAITLLTVITAGIHLYLGMRMGSGPGMGLSQGGNGVPGGSTPSGGAPPSDGGSQTGGGTPPAGGPSGSPPSGGPGGLDRSSLMSMLPLSLPVLFMLNGVGYIGLLAA